MSAGDFATCDTRSDPQSGRVSKWGPIGQVAWPHLRPTTSSGSDGDCRPNPPNVVTSLLTMTGPSSDKQTFEATAQVAELWAWLEQNYPAIAQQARVALDLPLDTTGRRSL